jgi:hypothetical protein
MKKLLFPDKSDLRNRIEALEEQRAQIDHEICVLKDQCDCSDYTMRHRTEEGSYYDRAKYYEFKECNVCGNRFDEQCIGTGYYG